MEFTSRVLPYVKIYSFLQHQQDWQVFEKVSKVLINRHMFNLLFISEAFKVFRNSFSAIGVIFKVIGEAFPLHQLFQASCWNFEAK